jgi:hypothetical protein
MSDESERDLSAAFDELRAPASTANYASRTSGIDIPSTRSRWPQAMASALAVAVALAGAGTFLALRSARQGGVASSGAAANPPARSGAAMVWDSTAGVTIMFGGSGSNGNTLHDVWTWDGSRWSAAAKGPGPLTDVRMVDDPADGGALLLGVPAVAISNGGGVSGCGTSVGSSGSGIATPAAAGAPAIAIATAPANVPTPASPPPGSSALPTCTPTVVAPTVVAPTEQTWLFTQHGWSHPAARGTAITPPAGSQLTYDSATRQVVAVSTGYSSCGLPLGVASAAGPAMVCPMLGAPSALTRPIHCSAVTSCTGGATVTTWTWSGTVWKAEPATAVEAGVVTLLFRDPTTQHATLMTSNGGGSPCASLPVNVAPPSVSVAPPSCAVVPPMTSTWSWTGTAWHLLSQQFIVQATPSLVGASVTPVSGHIVVLTGAGETWTFAAGQWTQDTVTGHPSVRSGAAMAEGPSSTVVLFGGSAGGYAYPLASGVAPAGSQPTASQATLGSDTWVWNGTSWRHIAGAAPAQPPVVGCPKTSSGLILPCAYGGVGTAAPATPLSSPLPNLHIVPQGVATPTP